MAVSAQALACAPGVFGWILWRRACSGKEVTTLRATTDHGKTDALPEHVTDNIEKIAELRNGVARRMSGHQRAVESATSAIGRPATLYVLFLFAVLWLTWNSAATALGYSPFDPAPFFWLQGIMCLYGAFVATMVLAAQNQQRSALEQRAHLELQVNLLSEQKVTKIIALLEELRRDLPMVTNRTDALAEAMQEQVDPKAVLSKLEDALEDAPGSVHAPEKSSRAQPAQ